MWMLVVKRNGTGFLWCRNGMSLQQLSFFSWSIVFHVTGALTKGDRRAASGADLTEFNFDTPYGRNALRAMYQSVCTVSRLLVLEPMVSLNSFRNIVKKFDRNLHVFHCLLFHIFHCISYRCFFLMKCCVSFKHKFL